MEQFTLPIYGLSVLLNLRRPSVAYIAAAFFVIEALHGFIGFRYYCTSFLSIAAFTVIPIWVANFAPRSVRLPMQESSFALVALYFSAWLVVESGYDNANFLYMHVLILLYQFWTMNRGCTLLAYLREHPSRVHRHHP